MEELISWATEYIVREAFGENPEPPSDKEPVYWPVEVGQSPC